MRKRLQITVSFLLLCSSLFAQPRWFWDQLPAADTTGSIAIALPDGNGIWSDSLRWWQSKLRIGLDTAATLADVRSLGFNESGTVNTLPLWSTGTTLGDSWLSQASNTLSITSGNLFRFNGHTTAGRPTGLSGHLGYNIDLDALEGYNDLGWFGIVGTSLSAGKFTGTYVPFSDSNGLLTESSGFTYEDGRLFISTGSNNFIGAGNTTLTGAENTAVGNLSSGSFTSAYGNSAFGHRTLVSTTSGSFNVALGHRAGDFISTGSNNVAIGTNSMRSGTTGGQNTGVGVNSLLVVQSASSNTAVGFGSLQNNTASSNSSLGWQSLNKNTSGVQNSAFGYRALATNTTSPANSAFGYEALESSTGQNNSAFGSQSLYNNLSGESNSAMGHAALFNNTDGSNNIAGGANSLQNNRTGSENIGFGAATLQDFVSKDGNTAVGYNAGSSLGFTIYSVSSFDSGTDRVTLSSPHGLSSNIFLKLSISSGSPNPPGGTAFSLIYEFSVVDATTLEFVNINISSNGSGSMELRGSEDYEYTTMLGYNSQVYKNNMVSIGAHEGTGAITNVRMRNYNFDVDQDTTGLDGQVLTFDSDSGNIKLQAPSSGSADTLYTQNGAPLADGDTIPIYTGAEQIAYGSTGSDSLVGSVSFTFDATNAIMSLLSSSAGINLGTGVSSGDDRGLFRKNSQTYTVSDKNAVIALQSYSSGTKYQGIFAGYGANGTETTPLAVTTTNTLLQISAAGHDGTSFSDATFSGTPAHITFNPTETYTTSAHGTAINFYTTQNGSIANDLVMTLNDGGDKTVTITGDLNLSGTGSTQIQTGTTAQRTAGALGEVRANSDNSDIEGNDGAEWKRFAWYNSTNLDVGNLSFNIDQTVGSSQDDYTQCYNDTSGEIELRPSALSTRGQLIETTANSLSTGVTFTRFTGLSGQNLSNFTATDSTLTYTGSEDVLVEINYTGTVYFDIPSSGSYRTTVKPYVNGGFYNEAISDLQIESSGSEDWVQPISGTTWVNISTNDVISLRYTATSGGTYSLLNLSLTVKAL